MDWLNASVGFLVISLADRPPGGVPLLLKDAGQEVAGTPVYAGVPALRDAGHRSTRTTSLARSFEEMGGSRSSANRRALRWPTA